MPRKISMQDKLLHTIGSCIKEDILQISKKANFSNFFYQNTPKHLRSLKWSNCKSNRIYASPLYEKRWVNGFSFYLRIYRRSWQVLQQPKSHLAQSRRNRHHAQKSPTRMYANPERWINGCEDLGFADFVGGFEHRHGRRWGTWGPARGVHYNPQDNSQCRCTCGKREEIRLAEIGDAQVLVWSHRKLAGIQIRFTKKKSARRHLTKRSKKKIRQKELSTWYLNVNKVSRFFSELFFSFFFFRDFRAF